MMPWNKGSLGAVKAWNKGLNLSEEYKKKVSVSTRIAMSKPEVKAKIRKTQFTKGLVPWNKGKVGIYKKETLEKIRNARLKQIFPKNLTDIELVLFSILDKYNLEYKKHFAIKNICQADAFIEPNIILFADGDYWHCNPRLYDAPKTQAQVKNIKRDIEENDKLIKEGYVVIRLWESDLLNKKRECEGRILSAIGVSK